MPEYLAPGVYIEETSFRSKSIEGVSTTTSGFIGPTRYGPLDLEPEIITSLGEFERLYGDRLQLQFSDKSDCHNYVWHAARAFFEEGGKRLYVSRVFSPISSTDGGIASAKVPELAADANAVEVRARFPGSAGNARVTFSLRIGQNVAGVNQAGQLALSSALTDKDIVWIGKRAAPAPDASSPVPAPVTTFSDSDAQELFNQLKAFLGAAPSQDAKEQARKLARRVVEATHDEASAAASTAQALETAAVQAGAAAAAKASEAAELERAALAAEESAAEALAGALIAKSVADDVPAAPPGPKTAAEKLADAAKARSDQAKTEADKARTAADAAKLSAKALLDQVTDPLAGAHKKAADARKAADAAREKGRQMAAAAASALPKDGPALPTGPNQTGSFYRAVYNTSAKAFEFQGGAAPHTLTADDEVRVVTLAVTVHSPSAGVFPRVWDGLAPDGAHMRSGANDSIQERFAPTLSNIAQARSTPIILTPGTAVKTGVEMIKALFALTKRQDRDDTEQNTPIVNNAGVVLRDYESADVLLKGGNDGRRPTADAYVGADDGRRKTGLKMFEDIEDVSILAAPGSTAGYENGYRADASAIVNALISHCQRMRYRIAVLDSGDGQTISQVRAMRAKLDSTYAALYYPWVRVLDPVTQAEIHLPPSGFVAGIYARNDINRAVYKAPANEVVNSAIGFEVLLNKGQQDVLNPEGINCFRFFEGRGFRLWGARTISSDPEWKYVNLRRYFIYLERSIDRGTQWAVFEPNGDALWANVRRTIEDFLLNEWQMGALLGEKPEKAFFVRCDRSTMTQNDLDNGRLVCLIGVAPLRPAEFVIFRIGQWTGDRKV